MDRYCPECNSSMTPSLVGYLCPDCGHLQRFYTDTATLSPATTQKEESLSASTGSDTAASDMQASSGTAESPERKKIRSTLKRLMVPELPPPHHEQLIADNEAAKEPTGLSETTNPLMRSETDSLTAADDTENTPKPTKKGHPVLWITIAALGLSVAGLAVVAYLYFR